jgi:nicotinate-nucleotide adenylyltransferase
MAGSLLMTDPDHRLPAFVPGMRIGLLGGSFDPPHAGHVAISRAALRALRLDQVWWLVSPHNPLKPNAPSDLAARIASARAIATDPRIKVTGIEAALGRPEISRSGGLVSGQPMPEINRSGGLVSGQPMPEISRSGGLASGRPMPEISRSYTAATLARLLPRLPWVDCVWLMGADNLASFHRWRDWRTIAASLPIAVFNRPGWALPALASPAALSLRRWRLTASDAPALPSASPPAWIYLPFPSVGASSTAIRSAIAAGVS